MQSRPFTLNFRLPIWYRSTTELEHLCFVRHCPTKRKEHGIVTMLGKAGRIEKLVNDLLDLEHDAIAAYDSCIERLDEKRRARTRKVETTFRRENES